MSIFSKMKEAQRLLADAHVARRTAMEASFLLHKHFKTESCPEWKEGVGDCNKPDCEFCRVRKCCDDLDSLSMKLKVLIDGNK